MTIGTLAVRSIVLNLYTKFEEDLMNSIVFFNADYCVKRQPP